MTHTDNEAMHHPMVGDIYRHRVSGLLWRVTWVSPPDRLNPTGFVTLRRTNSDRGAGCRGGEMGAKYELVEAMTHTEATHG